MKKKFLTVFISLLITGIIAQSQSKQDPVLITIDTVKITQSEFERIYNKNNTDTIIDQNSLNEYLDLFINFKLKVIEAERHGLDTLKAFEIELGGYRRQLEKPYLTDDSIDEELFAEAYERMKEDVNASHILLKIEEAALPKDTVIVYNKIIEIRNRILAGEDFAKIAGEVSEDPSAKNNGGNLGYFTVFQMVYPFETVAYNTKIGEISMPVRTKFGYHIIKTWNKREAIGKVKVAHIMRSIPRGSDIQKTKLAEDSINVIYQKLVDGEGFAELAKKYSDDKSSSNTGGELRMFSTGKMVREFEEAAFSLSEIGQISKPIKTAYGWHILKLLKKIEVGRYDEMKSLIKSKVSKDARAEKSKTVVIERLKKEYNFKFDKKKLAQFYTVVDSNIFKGNWSVESAKNLNADFVWFDDNTLGQKRFANFLANKRAPVVTPSIEAYVNIMFDHFVEKYIISYEKTQLERKYPEFKHLMQEYHDGILLFELTDKMVWTKAVEDTTGLLAFYESRKNNYMWGERFDGRIFTCKDEKTYKKLNKFLSKTNNVNLPSEEILAKYNKDGNEVINIEKDIFSKGDNENIDFFAWKIGTQLKDLDIIITGNKIDPMPKKLNEAKGLITADYQSYLEEKWVNELRNKYDISVDEEIFKKIK